MDLAFTRRAERILQDRNPARLDHALLLTALAAQQRESLPREQDPAPPPVIEDDSLTELLVGGAAWKGAVKVQRGCFSRAEAGRRVNAP